MLHTLWDKRRKCVRSYGHHKWWTLYILAPVAAALLYFDGHAHASLETHKILTIATIILLCGAALYWTETHSDVIQSEGVDAHSAANFYRTSGIFISGSTTLAIPVGPPRRDASASSRPSTLELNQVRLLSAAHVDDTPAPGRAEIAQD
jgi:hypothetical protein